MALQKPVATQIENRNFLQPTGFRFQVNRAPKISFFGKSVNIPSLDLGVAIQPNYLKPIPLPGEIIEFEDLTFSFLVDEGLENYMEIQNWIRGIGFPESLQQIYEFQRENTPIKSRSENIEQLNLYSDGTLTVLDSSNQPKFKVKFQNLFPYRLSTLEFDATQTNIEYFTAVVSFKYTIYNIDEITSCC